jgi:hypothetical protein
MRATRRNLQAQPKIRKKIIGTPNIPIKTKIFLKKNYDSHLKSVKEPKIRIRATRWNLQAQPKMLKRFVGISNQSIKTIIFPQKLYLIT